jgi:hypothetical protein
MPTRRTFVTGTVGAGAVLRRKARTRRPPGPPGA